jgi:hypothetical protein
MKTLLFIILGVIIGAIAMWAYQQYGKENEPMKGYKSFNFTESELEALKEYKGGDPIPPNEALQMRRVSGLSTTSVWFSADTLDKYFSKWAAFNEATGIRVYLARYDSNNYYANRNNPDKMDLRGQYTVFIVPTRDSVSTVGGLKQTFRVDISEKFAYPVNRGYSCPPYPDSICKGQSYQ